MSRRSDVSSAHSRGLQRADTVSIPMLGPRQPDDRIPLTFTQQAHWNSYAARERPTVREVASATLLRGSWDLEAFRRSILQVVWRHEALRARVAFRAGVPEQEIFEPAEHDVLVDDLTALLPHEREAEFKRLLTQVILDPVDLVRDAPFLIRAARVGRDEHVLIVAMNHLICDGYSMRIVLGDLLTAYECETCDLREPWHAVPVQFADYSVWQRRTHPAWLEKHGPYWTQRLAECQRLRFPECSDPPSGCDAGWGRVSFRIGDHLKAELQASSRVHRTTLMMTIFATYAAVALRWCETSEAIIRFQTNGRANAKLQTTVGFFASTLSLRVALQPRDDFVDLLQRVTAEYCSACAHADAGYLESQWPLPPFARNCIFNWLPLATHDSRSSAQGTHEVLTASPIRFENPALTRLRLDNEPIMTLHEAADCIDGEVAFPLNRFSTSIIESFTRCFLKFLRELSHDPTTRVTSLRLE